MVNFPPFNAIRHNIFTHGDIQITIHQSYELRHHLEMRTGKLEVVYINTNIGK